jgi:hypothetical protein
LYTSGNVTDAKYVIGDVTCHSFTTPVVLQCNFTPKTQCTTYPVAVTCYGNRLWDLPFNGMVRLQDGLYSNVGRVEVYCNGAWGAVCASSSNSSNIALAESICRQLGYNKVYSHTTTNKFSKAWLSNVTCSSGQNCLSSCTNGQCHSLSSPCTSAVNVTCGT